MYNLTNSCKLLEEMTQLELGSDITTELSVKIWFGNIERDDGYRQSCSCKVVLGSGLKNYCSLPDPLLRSRFLSSQ